jgi:hypothetical protein
MKMKTMDFFHTRTALALRLVHAGMNCYLANRLANEDVSGGAHISEYDLSKMPRAQAVALVADFDGVATDKGVWFPVKF